MDPARAVPWDRIPSYGSLAGDTVYIAVVDAEGNAVSLIHSLYGGFGAAVVAGRTGVVLQNRSAYFSLDPKSPNRVEPGKTPLHTLIASMAFRERQAVGRGGLHGRRRPAADPPADLPRDDRPRPATSRRRWRRRAFCPAASPSASRATRCTSKARFPAETIAELERRGHLLNRWGAWNELAGHAHGITIDPASGLRVGGADPRSDGAAIGSSSPDRGPGGRGQTPGEALVVVLHHGLAGGDVGRKAADIGHEHARLAGNVGADVPGAAGRAQRDVRRPRRPGRPRLPAASRPARSRSRPWRAALRGSRRCSRHAARSREACWSAPTGCPVR